jgi:hypothetical protein
MAVGLMWSSSTGPCSLGLDTIETPWLTGLRDEFRRRGARNGEHGKGEKMRGIRDARKAALTCLVLGSLLALPAGASAAGASYVALGDSYTSGPGVLPYVPTAPPECGQSELNYPHLVASALSCR